MPSSTALLETDEGESEVPPPLVHAFAGIGLSEPGTHSRTPEQGGDSFPHFGFLGAVLDLKPLVGQRSTEAATTNDEESEVALDSNNGTGNLTGSAGSTLLAQAHNHQQHHHHHVFAGPGESMAPPSGIEPPPPLPETILLYDHEDLVEDAAGGGLHSVLLPSDIYGGEPGYETEEQCLLMRRRSVNTTECVAVPSSEHVAEIVGRQGCKIKALRAKTNTYIKTPVRGDQPVFVVTGRKEDVAMAKREILSAAEHFSLIRASRNKTGPLSVVAGPGLPGAPTLPGQTTIQVRVPYRVVGLVVGPKGATIKRIQQQTHTYIVTPSRDKEPVFEVTGMPENVDRAREEIEAHIALRTGTCGGMELPGADDNDFHFNGTDVSFEGLSAAAAAAAAGMGHAAWLQSATAASASSGGSGGLPAMATTGAGTPQVNANFGSGGVGSGVKMSSTYRNDSSSSLGSGSSSADSFYGAGNLNRMADFSPTCSLNANANNNNNGGGGGSGASFWFGDGVQPLGSEEMVGSGGVRGGGTSSSGFDPLTISTAPGAGPLPQPPIWSPYMEHQGHEACKNQTSQPGTPRLSPTFLQGADALEHPQAQRVQQRASLDSAGAPESHRFAGYGPAFSSSSESTASASSSSPPDSSFPYRSAPGAVAMAAANRGGGGLETCIHCMESQVVAALVPCGHHLFCLECATRICRGPDAACPVCFYPVTQAIQLRNM